jgi:hypothetical protein
MTTCKHDSVEAIRSVVIFLRGENLCETGSLIAIFLYKWVKSKSIRWKAKTQKNIQIWTASALRAQYVTTPNRNPNPVVAICQCHPER